MAKDFRTVIHAVQGLRIRQIGDDDWHAIMAIQRLVYGSTLLEAEAVLRSKAELSPGTCLVGVGRDGKVVAYILAHPYPVGKWPNLGAVARAFNGGSNILLHDLAVHGDASGQGVGTAMFGRVEKAARLRGFSTLSLIAVQNAAGYWRRLGFEAQGHPSPEKGYGDDARLMQKIL
jgi:predicted N-acetyltransferase YhbS